MAYKNLWVGEGNLTKDIEIKHTSGGKTVAEFSIAVNERYQDKQTGEWKNGDTLFMDCEAWERTAEGIEKWLAQVGKGAPVHVEGKIKKDTWDDKQTGEKRSKYVCNVFQFTPLLRREKDDENGSPQGGQQRQAPQGRQPAPSRSSGGNQDNFSFGLE